MRQRIFNVTITLPKIKLTLYKNLYRLKINLQMKGLKE